MKCDMLWKWSDGLVNKEWHMRFFVLDLDNCTLQYFKSEGDTKKSRGKIHLQNAVVSKYMTY